MKKLVYRISGHVSLSWEHRDPISCFSIPFELGTVMWHIRLWPIAILVLRCVRETGKLKTSNPDIDVKIGFK